MQKRELLISKLYRLKMSQELRHLLREIPVYDIQEIPKGDHIYLGVGKILLGAREHEATIRVFGRNGGIFIQVSSKEPNLNLMIPFNNAKERETIREKFSKAFAKCLN